MTPRRYTIFPDVTTYGDGLTVEEIRAMADAEARALRRVFPDVEIRVTEEPHDGEDDDPVVLDYVVGVWDRLAKRLLEMADEAGLDPWEHVNANDSP